MALKRNAAWNLAGMGLPLLAAAVFIPPLLAGLGDAAFGVVALLWTLIGYVSLFDFGVGRALTVRLSQLRHAGQADDARHALWAGLLITAVSGLAGAILLWALAPSIAHWLEISDVLREDTVAAFTIVALGVLPATLASGLRGALEGQNRFAVSNVIRIAFGVLTFGLPVLAMQIHGVALAWIALYLVVARWLFCLLAVLPLYRDLKGEISRVKIRQHSTGLFSIGFWVSVTGVIGPLMIYGDRFFVGVVVGAEELPYYAIPQEGLLRLLIIPNALAGALLPALAALSPMQMGVVCRQNSRRIAAFMFVVCALSLALAEPALSWWISPEFAEKALPVVVVMMLGVWVNSLAQVPYTVLHAAGKTKLTALFHLAELPVYFLMLYVLASLFGLPGAAAAWGLRALMDYLLLHFAAKRQLREGS